MENLIIIVVIVAILALASFKIIKEKKAGAKCIGCPNSKQCDCD